MRCQSRLLVGAELRVRSDRLLKDSSTREQQINVLRLIADDVVFLMPPEAQHVHDEVVGNDLFLEAVNGDAHSADHAVILKSTLVQTSGQLHEVRFVRGQRCQDSFDDWLERGVSYTAQFVEACA